MRLCILLMAGLLSACVGSQNPYQPGHNTDLGEKPGLLSGAQGYFEFTLRKPPPQSRQGELDPGGLPLANYEF
jgi:hypothetical protein